jgi:polyphosphate kinase 2 (PPK2 family)
VSTKLAVTVEHGKRFHLAEVDPAATGGLDGKKEAVKRLERNLERLHELQEILYAERRHALLVVLQAMDTAARRHHRARPGCVQPQGCR